MIQLRSQIPNLFPEQARRALTTAAFQLNDWSSDFDHSGVEINGAASR
jgi:hypothetical protein